MVSWLDVDLVYLDFLGIELFYLIRDLYAFEVLVRFPSYSFYLVMMLNKFEKGVEHFQRALEISPKSITAQFGLSSGLLGLAKECINRGAFKWASFLLEVCYLVSKGYSPLTRFLLLLYLFFDFRKHLKLQEEVHI